MIDKIELRVPRISPFRPTVQEVIREIDYVSGRTRVAPSRHYRGVIDLRPFGIDALLHAYCRHGDHNHKLELLDTGKKTYSDLVQQIESAFATDPMKLKTMRVDLCADVPGVPVCWFQPRARVQYKRFARERGEMDYEQMGNRKIETLTAGKRPNLIRIYDKVAECKMQFDKLRRKQRQDSARVDFEKEFGLRPDAVLTRIERQCGGARVPEELGTFGKLANAPDYNPFSALEIMNGTGGMMPTVEQCGGVAEWLQGTRLHELAVQWGMQPLRTWLNRHSNGNAARTLERYRAFLPNDDEHAITTETIYEMYRQSAIRQLSA